MLGMSQARHPRRPAGRGSENVKLISKERTPITLIAETPGEVAMAEIFLDGMNYARYATTKKGARIVKAKYSIIPDQEGK